MHQTLTRQFFLLLILMLLRAGSLSALSDTTNPPRMPRQDYRLVTPTRPAAKNMYFLNVLDHTPLLKKTLSDDPVLRRISETRFQEIENLNAQRPLDVQRFLSALVFSEQEIEAVGDRLVALYAELPMLRDLLSEHLIPSGAYFTLAREGEPSEVLKKIWELDARAVNLLIDVYGMGVQPPYKIDSVSMIPGTPKHTKVMEALGELLLTVRSKAGSSGCCFYELPLFTAELLLDLDDRDEMTVYEPLDEGENKAVKEAMQHTDWSKYPYSCIMVLGAGPDNYAFPLSEEGKVRVRIGAQLFTETGVAPILAVSGGKVYPYKTKNVEAYHMKRYLMERLSIPEDRILIDPHARHTTSNIRNVIRLLFRYGVPMDKPIIVTSSSYHIDRVENGITDRYLREMGAVPFTLGRRLSPNCIEIYPLPVALQINPRDPLDA